MCSRSAEPLGWPPPLLLLPLLPLFLKSSSEYLRDRSEGGVSDCIGRRGEDSVCASALASPTPMPSCPWLFEPKHITRPLSATTRGPVLVSRTTWP